MRREPLEAAFGPMFACEWRVAARRGSFQWVRAGFVAVLLAAIGFAWYATIQSYGVRTPMRLMADLGESIFSAFAAVQLALVMVVAPGATAGAICLDRARGTLLHLMVTDLTAREIVLGKIGARLMGMLGLVLAAFPVMALMTLLGGIDPRQLAGAFAVTIGIAVLGCSLALLLSVWANKAHEVVMAVYLVWVAWILAWPVAILLYQTFFGFVPMSMPWLGPGSWLALANPAWILFGPIQMGSKIGLTEQLGFAGATIAVSVVLVAVAAWRIRPSATTERSRSWIRLPRIGLDLSLDRFLPGPSLDYNPVLWREWHRNRPSRWSRAVWWTYGLVAGGFTVWVLADQYVRGYRFSEPLTITLVLVVGVGLLLLSVSAATVLAEERVRGSLDVLMTTPLSTRSIVLGKWLGGQRRAAWLAVLPAMLAIPPAWTSGRWYGAFLIVAAVLVEGALIVSLGLWIATMTPRLGRAIGFSVGAYALVAIGWPLMVASLFYVAGGDVAEFLLGFSPLFDVGMLAEGIFRGRYADWVFANQAYGTVWLLAKAGLAVVIYAIALIGFERRLGRITMTQEKKQGRG